MSDKGQLIELPNGRLYFVEADHSYWRCKPDGGRGKRLTGVSTVCAPYDFRPDALLRWVERLTLEGVSLGFHGETVPDDPHLLRQRLDQEGLRWEQLRDDAAERGTNVHEQTLHALAAGDDIPNLDELPPEHRGYGQAVLKWWMDRDPDPTHSEQVVLHDEHGFAGRLDLRARIRKGPYKGAIALPDLKTSGFIATKAHAQVAGYDLGAVTSLDVEPADVLLVIQVGPDGTYTEVPVQATHEDFLVALDLYRRAARINGAARKARDGQVPITYDRETQMELEAA